MSKAFTRESDDAPETPIARRPAASLPPGVNNYFTTGGLNKLRRELETLTARTDSTDVRRRISEIEQLLASAVPVPAPPLPWDQVLFGATVTVKDQHGEQSICRIVGVDEMNLDRDWISWRSPLARALLKARVGDRVNFRAPAGERQLEIIAISYE